MQLSRQNETRSCILRPALLWDSRQSVRHPRTSNSSTKNTFVACLWNRIHQEVR